MLGGQGEELSSAHPLELVNLGWKENVWLCLALVFVLPGAERCCRPTTEHSHRQAQRHKMTSEHYPG